MTDGSVESDTAALTDGIRRGDRGVFDALCLKYFEMLWRFAFGMLRSREAAQDVVQDVFLNVWERRSEFFIETSPAAYLFGAVRRRALVYLRNDRTAERIASTWAPEDVPALGVSPELPSSRVEQREVTVMLERALASLPEIRRQVIMLRWGEHLDYADIAQAMGISADAARTHVSRAYKTLRELLQTMGAEPPE